MSEAVRKNLKKYNVLVTMKPASFTLSQVTPVTKDDVLEHFWEELRSGRLDELFTVTIDSRMIAEVGSPCLLCQRPMHKTTKPNWIFDLEKQELRGLAHQTCTYKAALPWYASKSTKWGEESPSPSQIEFGCKIVQSMNKLDGYGLDSDEFFCKMLLYECLWKTRTLEECLGIKRVNELLDWWLNGPEILSLHRHNRIKQLFIRTLEEASSQ